MSNFGYRRVVEIFDRDDTAAEFVSPDGEGGFAAAVYRMAREIDRLRARLAEHESLRGQIDPAVEP